MPPEPNHGGTIVCFWLGRSEQLHRTAFFGICSIYTTTTGWEDAIAVLPGAGLHWVQTRKQFWKALDCHHIYTRLLQYQQLQCWPYPPASAWVQATFQHYETNLQGMNLVRCDHNVTTRCYFGLGAGNTTANECQEGYRIWGQRLGILVV